MEVISRSGCRFLTNLIHLVFHRLQGSQTLHGQTDLTDHTVRVSDVVHCNKGHRGTKMQPQDFHNVQYCKTLNMQARSQGGGGSGGSDDPPPQLPIPKILFHPLAILFHPLAILFHPLAILFHPLAILFHPSAILFHPWNVDDVTRAMSKGGGACECPRGGCFSIFRRADDVMRTMPKGGCL